MTRGQFMMNKMLKFAIATTLLSSVNCLQFFEDSDNVVVIKNKKDLASKVLESSTLTLLGAFSEDPEECPGCDKLASEFKKASKNLAGYGVSTFAVDCTGSIPSCHGMTKDLMLTNIPFVKGYVDGPTKNPYTNKWGRDGVIFDGNADARSLQKHILNKIPNILATRQTLETFPPETNDQSLVLLFTERDSPSVLIKALAYHFDGRLTFAEVSESETELMEKFAVSDTPSLVVTLADKSKKDSEMGVVYKGDNKNWNEIIEFLEPFAMEKTQKVNPKQEKSNESSDIKTIAKSAELLSENSFTTEVLESKKAWAVLYYHLSNFNKIDNKYDEWKKSVEKYTNQGPMMRFGEVNCTATPQLCKTVSPKKSSIIIYDYVAKDKMKRDEVETSTDIYPLSETMEAIESLSNSVSDLTYKMNSGNMEQIASEAIQQEKILLILASNKDEPPMMLKQLAIDLSSVAVVAFFPSPNAQMMQQFQLDRLPTFFSMYPQVDENQKEAVGFGLAKFEPRRYGKPTFEAVFSFTVQVAMSVNPNSVETLQKEKEAEMNAMASPSASVGDAGPIKEVTVESWAKLCDARSSKLCAIAFLNGGESSSTFEHDLEIAQSAFNAHVKDPYSFMWVNGACQSELAESFDVQPNQLPTVVVYSPKKNRFASFIGSYNVDSVRDLLSGVLSGRVKTREIFQLTPPQDRDCSLINGEIGSSTEEVIVEDEEDMSDMMAEILAEEEKKKKELAAELKAEAAAKKKAEEEKKKLEAEAAKSSKKKKKKKSKKKSNEL